MHATLPLMRSYGFPALRRGRTETLQVNLGYKCNQSCLHWHVNAGPTRTEMMSAEVLADVFSFLAVSSVRKLDITGGAPELHPRFRDLVLRAGELGAHVIDRCNLTILGEPGQEDLDSFLAENKVEITASLPCYTPELVDRQRYVYDCDFNQMLDLPLTLKNKPRPRLADLIGRDVAGNPVAVRDHCYGCTAGQGSSCGGALNG